MRRGVPRAVVLGLAVVFSAYVIVLGVYDIHRAGSAVPVITAMVLFGVAVVLDLLPFRSGPNLPIWAAAFSASVIVAIALLVTSQLDLDSPDGLGYSTWYVAASGVLCTIVCFRGHPIWAWIGIGFLVLHTVIWVGPLGIVSIGVVGSISWVTLAHVMARTLARAARDARRFGGAEREAADWQAAQDAHVTERQFRLGQTSAMAVQMLRTIERAAGDLTEAQRQECLHLEGAIRDEIRGRRLLTDAVRVEVMRARRRGAVVTLLDEGGIDDLADGDLERVLDRLARALRAADADRLIVRTVPEGSDVAVTVVGLRNPSEEARLLGLDDDDESVVLWLEIPRRDDDAAADQARASASSVANR